MDDLRIGLVEATRRAIDDWPTDADGNLDVGAVVDVQLGFLTDNAEAWEEAAVAEAVLVKLRPPPSDFVAVLRDRDRP